MKATPEKIILFLGAALIILVISYVIYLGVWWWRFDSDG